MGGTKVVRNAAKESKHLLDVILETKSAAIALAEFKSKRASTLTKGDVKELDLLVEALKCAFMMRVDVRSQKSAW